MVASHQAAPDALVFYRCRARCSQAVEQKWTNRRNATREAQCLSILRALQRANAGAELTRAELADRLGYGSATIGRAQQVLARGAEAEIIAVLVRREAEEREPLKEVRPATTPGTLSDDDYEEDDQEPKHEAPEGLTQARDLTHTLAGRVDRLQEAAAGRGSHGRDSRHQTRDRRRSARPDRWAY